MDRITNSIVRCLNDNKFSPRDIELFTYGLNISLRYLLFGAFIFGLLFFLGNIGYVLVFDLVLVLLRFHCGGYHTEKVVTCFLLSVFSLVICPASKLCSTVLVIVPEIGLSYNISAAVSCLFMTICFIFMLRSQPIQNEKKKLNSDFVNKVNQRKNIIIVFFYILFLFQLIISNQIANMMMLAFLYNVLSMLVELIRKGR